MELSGRIFIKEIGSEFSLRSPFEALETLLRFRFETFGQKTKNFFSKIYLYLFLGPLQSGKCHFPRKLNWSHLEISSRCRTSVLFSFQKTFFSAGARTFSVENHIPTKEIPIVVSILWNLKLNSLVRTLYIPGGGTAQRKCLRFSL